MRSSATNRCGAQRLRRTRRQTQPHRALAQQLANHGLVVIEVPFDQHLRQARCARKPDAASPRSLLRSPTISPAPPKDVASSDPGEVLAGSMARGNVHADTLLSGARTNLEGIACIQTVPKTCPDQDRLRPTIPSQSTPCCSIAHSQLPPIGRNLRGSIGVDVAVVNPRKRQRADGARNVAVDTTVRRPVVPEPQTTAPKDTRVCRTLSRPVRWADGRASHGFVSIACQLCRQSRRELAGQRLSRTLPLFTFTARPPEATTMHTDAHDAGREERRAQLERRRAAVAHQLRRLATELADIDRQLDEIEQSQR